MKINAFFTEKNNIQKGWNECQSNQFCFILKHFIRYIIPYEYYSMICPVQSITEREEIPVEKNIHERIVVRKKWKIFWFINVFVCTIFHTIFIQIYTMANNKQNCYDIISRGANNYSFLFFHLFHISYIILFVWLWSFDFSLIFVKKRSEIHSFFSFDITLILNSIIHYILLLNSFAYFLNNSNSNSFGQMAFPCLIQMFPVKKF